MGKQYRKQNPSPGHHVPVIVDAERNIDGIEMVRCAYYSVQADEPLPNWSLTLVGDTYPILMLNLEAIILGPSAGKNMFASAGDFDEMYENIEGENSTETGLFVDVNDIWIPKHWFPDIKLSEGMIFRIPEMVFSLCWRLRNDRISTEEFKDQMLALDGLIERHISFSEEETGFLKNWTGKQIEMARVNYHEGQHEYRIKRKKK